MASAPLLAKLNRRVAAFVDDVLKGRTVSPVEQATKCGVAI